MGLFDLLLLFVLLFLMIMPFKAANDLKWLEKINKNITEEDCNNFNEQGRVSDRMLIFKLLFFSWTYENFKRRFLNGQ